MFHIPTGVQTKWKGIFITTLAEALGFATLCLLWVVGPLASGKHDLIYHWSGQPWMAFVPPLVDLVVLWVLLGALLLLAACSRRAQPYVWLGLVFLLPSFIVKDCATMLNWKPPYHLPYLLLEVSAMLFVLLLTAGRGLARRHLAQVHRVMSVLLRSAGVSGAILVCQLLWFAGKAHGLNRAMPTRAAAQGRGVARGPRVIWIVLDELSYDQVYGRRFAGLKLPAFDRFAAQATNFTNVDPAGDATEVVLPALLLGEPVDDIRSSPAGMLSVHLPARGWQRFDAQNNVFADADAEGYRTAVDGWYNPYCRILAGVLDRCYWQFTLPLPNHIGSHFSLLQNMTAPFRRTEEAAGVQHIDDYKELLSQADQTLQDASLDFVLLHMPIPHPDGIYDRRTSRFRATGGSYLDNLALADQYIAHVRSLLEAKGEWDSDAVIVMGDHSWRTKLLWERSPGWTDEDQRASHGGEFDNRPTYIVKLPQQQQAVLIDTRFAATRTRSLLDGVLDGSIQTPQQLRAWAK